MASQVQKESPDKIGEGQSLSKKEKKRQKIAKKQNQQQEESGDKEENEPEAEVEGEAKEQPKERTSKKKKTEKEVVQISDILFKSQFEDIEPVNVGDLFCNSDIALSVVTSDVENCEPLKLTPKKLYQDIKNLAEKRYQYIVLPKKLTQIKSLDKETDKISILRDICMAIGVTVDLGTKAGTPKELVLENESKKMKELISKIISK